MMDGLEADQAIAELAAEQPPATMGRLAKLSYTHQAMVDLIVENPAMSQGQLAAAFGYSPAWICNVLASDAFQERLAARREEVVDPVLKASLEERFRALTIRSLEVLQEKLAKPAVSDNVALRAAELGAKALGIGGNAPPPAPKDDAGRLEKLADRLIALQTQRRPETYENVQDAEIIPAPQAS